MTRFTAIDLSALDPPNVIEELDFEAILSELKSDCVARLVESGIGYDVASLESDPVVKVLETAAYRETLVRGRINSDLRAVLIAKAQQADLEHRGASYGIERRLVSPATENAPAVYESDELLRQRISLAPEAFASAGPEGAYLFHTLTADPNIRNAAARQIGPGKVEVTFLVSDGIGYPDQELINKVAARLRDPKIKPLTDEVSVVAPDLVDYAVKIELVVALGIDQNVIASSAKNALEIYVSDRHKIGNIIYTSGLIAAAKVAGVEHVILTSPTTNIDPGEAGAAYASCVDVTARHASGAGNASQPISSTSSGQHSGAEGFCESVEGAGLDAISDTIEDLDQ